MKRWEALTYRDKNKVLVLMVLLFIVLAYFLSIGKTIEAIALNDSMQKELKRAEQAPQNILRYEQQLEMYSRKLGTFSEDSLVNQEYALQVISNYCKDHELILRRFPEAQSDQQKDLKVQTSKVEVEGDFSRLLSLVYHLEQVNTVGRVTSIAFEMQKDRDRKKMILVLIMYIQNLTKNEDEESITI